MKQVIGYLIHASIIFGIIIGHWHGVVEAKNLSMASIWLLIAISVLYLLVPHEKKPKHSKIERLISRIFIGITIITMYAAGWFFLSSVYMVTCFIVVVKNLHDENNASTTVA